MASEAVLELIDQLGKSWPATWPTWGQEATGEHPLNAEIQAIMEGGWGSLPYFRPGRISWITVAPNGERLKEGIASLRSWLLPSFGWEHPKGAIKPPEAANGVMATLLADISPSGYFRWLTTAGSLPEVVRKLRDLRDLEQLRPPFGEGCELSLFELRQEFRLALATGDHDLASLAIDQIDRRQLDTAANTRFMRIRMQHWFREYATIVDLPDLSDILQLRMPNSVRVAIAEAFYQRYIGSHEAAKDSVAAEAAYREHVHETLGGLLRTCRSDDGEGVAHLLCYFERCTGAQKRVANERLADALRNGDWRTIQELGPQLLADPSAPEGWREVVRYALVGSLRRLPNPKLSSDLGEKEAQLPAPIQDWPGWVEALRLSDFDRCQAFLANPERPAATLSDPRQTAAFIAAIEELTTDPLFESSSKHRDFWLAGLPALAEDLITDLNFPANALLPAYDWLLTVWLSRFRGSQHPPHQSVLLALGRALIALAPGTESRIFDAIREWWTVRRTPSLLPFVAEGLELLGEYSDLSGDCEALWIDAMGVVQRREQSISPGERKLWQELAGQLGIARAVVEEYLPVQPEAMSEVDILADLGVKRIAIISLQEKQATTAAQMIRDRTGAEVTVSTDKVPGSQTEAAKRAEVILFVWAAAKHAVFAALDDVRDRIAYVQGTGASSIMMALEHWALQR
jgi:hypothetical protein